MEDASLDDFFAKKDKSKKKSKSSKSTPGDILSKTDEPAKKEKKTKKDKDKSHSSSNTTDDNRTTGAIVNQEEEEEWKEQEEEKEKDYTGLRIANLQTSEEGNEEEEQQEEKEEEEDENGEIKEKKDTGQQGPWKGSGAAPVVVKPVPVPQPVEESPAAEQPVAEAPKPTKYIPPGQRAGAAGATSTGPTLPSHLKKKKNAPNLRSEEDFPTLGGGPMPVQADGDSRVFERVQYGGRQTDEITKGSQQLSLGNKFSALQD